MASNIPEQNNGIDCGVFMLMFCLRKKFDIIHKLNQIVMNKKAKTSIVAECVSNMCRSEFVDGHLEQVLEFIKKHIRSEESITRAECCKGISFLLNTKLKLVKIFNNITNLISKNDCQIIFIP